MQIEIMVLFSHHCAACGCTFEDPDLFDFDESTDDNWAPICGSYYSRVLSEDQAEVRSHTQHFRVLVLILTIHSG